MIKSIRHKGLKRFFETGNTSGIQAKHAQLLRQRLAVLNRAKSIDDIRFFQNYNLHQLQGKESPRWSIKVNGNWRLTFEFNEADIYVLDYEDYH
ncbi:MAG: type II toxin-antitoxin system RelE/ParE family toxin [Thermosynechococcaceae cyanobacterium]